MKPEIKQRWLEALRSGEYRQGKGNLRMDDRFCCLGVLCDIAGPELGGRWGGSFYVRSDYDDLYEVADHGGEASDVDLPEFVREGLGVPDCSPDIRLPSGHLVLRDARCSYLPRRQQDGTAAITLAGLNDAGFTFAEIADLIEEFL